MKGRNQFVRRMKIGGVVREVPTIPQRVENGVAHFESRVAPKKKKVIAS